MRFKIGGLVSNLLVLIFGLRVSGLFFRVKVRVTVRVLVFFMFLGLVFRI